jgi:5,6,7,8-tetrahydromethanopterin hydro-lyase
VQIGESFIGSGHNAAHINTVLGAREGPVGAAWASALASPSVGFAPFVAIGRPGVAITPPTLFVNKAAISGATHGDLTWGAAQAGVATGVARALEDGTIDANRCRELVLIAAVWVNPQADDAEAIYANNAEATFHALHNGRSGFPTVEEFLLAGNDPWNPFYRSP